MKKQPLITLTSDFGRRSQGIGIMEGVIFEIAPKARLIHFMHGLPDFDTTAAARTLETLKYMPIGFHVCVVDPGVGTSRRGLIIKTKRGDCLIGPDNGVLIPTINFLGGFEKAVEITNPKYMRHPVSPLFHGRDVFAPVAAHLSNDVPMEKFGKEIPFQKLCAASYEEAVLKGNSIEAKVISINKYGSIHLNILNTAWDKFNLKIGQEVKIYFGRKQITAIYETTFGNVPKGKEVILKDDYVRVEVAINYGNFSEKYGISVGDKCEITKI